MKRLFDIVCSGLLLLILLPFMLIFTPLVRFKMKGPAFFTQMRSGYLGRPFKLYKLRSMMEAYDNEGKSLPDEVRLTRFGKTIRQLSMDELPQLWNILKGDMSFVGPRPLLTRYLGRYSVEQRKRLLVKPGVTGWAQVNGRNTLSWEDKFKYDVWYVQNQSWRLDIKILLLTVKKVLFKDDINQDGQATAEEFMGSE